MSILRITLIVGLLTLLLDIVFCSRAGIVAKHLSKLDIAAHARVGPGELV